MHVRRPPSLPDVCFLDTASFQLHTGVHLDQEQQESVLPNVRLRGG